MISLTPEENQIISENLFELMDGATPNPNTQPSVDSKDDETRLKIKHQISKHTGTGNALNSYATLREINQLGDEIMQVVKQYGIDQRIDEVNKLPDCNIESKYRGSTNVILVKDAIKRVQELEALKSKETPSRSTLNAPDGEPCDYCKQKGREYTPECEENK